jgi:hypothetical protein
VCGSSVDRYHVEVAGECRSIDLCVSQVKHRLLRDEACEGLGRNKFGLNRNLRGQISLGRCFLWAPLPGVTMGQTDGRLWLDFCDRDAVSKRGFCGHEADGRAFSAYQGAMRGLGHRNRQVEVLFDRRRWLVEGFRLENSASTLLKMPARFGFGGGLGYHHNVMTFIHAYRVK